MNRLIVKYQLLFLSLVILITTSVITGISANRRFAKEVNLAVTTKNLAQPIEQYYAYRLAKAESDDQTILETIINPKKTPAMAGQPEAKSIPVLLYHGIVKTPDTQNITDDQFKEQMYALKNAGYQTISLDDYTKFLNGENKLPEKSFLLTFDDGRKDSYYPVDPILKALNYQATIFVITEHLNQNNQYYLSKQELKTMQQSGRWTIGAHARNAHDLYDIDDKGTKGHFYSNKLWLKAQNRLETDEEFKNRIQTDLAGAKADLEQSGFPTTSFAFPFGDFGQFSQNYPESATIVPNIAYQIYQNNFYQIYNANPDSFKIQNYFNSTAAFSKRLEITQQVSGDQIVAELKAGEEKSLPFQDTFENPYNWKSDWGLMSTQDKSLLVGADKDTTGGAAFLIGSSEWENYQAQANIQWLMGNTFSFHARVKDSQNYLTCDFADSNVQISQKINGQTSILEKKKLKEPFDPAGAKFSVSVSGNTISCAINDTEVISTDKVDSSLNQGGIGFSTWDKETGNSAILVNNLSVSEVQLINDQLNNTAKKTPKNTHAL